MYFKVSNILTNPRTICFQNAVIFTIIFFFSKCADMVLKLTHFEKKPQCVIFHSALQHRDFIIRGISESKSLNTVTREVLTAIPGTRKNNLSF